MGMMGRREEMPFQAHAPGYSAPHAQEEGLSSIRKARDPSH